MFRSLLASLTAGGLALAAPSPALAQADDTPRRVAIVVWPGVELLDFAGPGEVFGATHGFEVYTVASDAEAIVSQGFLSVNPTHDLASAPAPDVIVLPGGGSSRASQDAALLQWLRASAPQAEVVLTVCTGAYVLAAAGLLDGLEATTYQGAIDHLREFASQTVVHRGRRWVDNGRVVTATGVSAGIDAALHVLGRLRGTAQAQATADYMQYDWRPEAHRWAENGLEGSGAGERSATLAAALEEAANSPATSPVGLSATTTAIEFHRRRGRHEHAAALAAELVNHTEKSEEQQPLLHALSLRLWGRCLLELGDLETAEDALLDSLEKVQTRHETSHPAAQAALSLLARLYEEDEDREAAEFVRRQLWQPGGASGSAPARTSPALKGLDPVALVEGTELAGSTEIDVWDGRYRYVFASAEHRDRFLADPARYGIQAQGACAAMGAGARPGQGDPVLFSVHEGRIYIFASAHCQAEFVAAPAASVAALPDLD